MSFDGGCSNRSLSRSSRAQSCCSRYVPWRRNRPLPKPPKRCLMSLLAIMMILWGTVPRRCHARLAHRPRPPGHTTNVLQPSIALQRAGFEKRAQSEGSIVGDGSGWLPVPGEGANQPQSSEQHDIGFRFWNRYCYRHVHRKVFNLSVKLSVAKLEVRPCVEVTASCDG